MTEAVADYTPTRASERTERNRLVATIADLESQLEAVEQRSERGADPSYQRAAYRIRKDIEKARERLDAFDAKHKGLEQAAASDEAATARKRVIRAAEKFEKALEALRVATVELLDALAELSKASGARVGYWPHAQSTIAAVVRRAQYVLLGAGLKFDVHAPRGEQPNIAERFKHEQA